MSNINYKGLIKRGFDRILRGRGSPKWDSQGVWFVLPKRLQGVNNFAFGAEYHIRISALLCLRRYLSAADPLLVAMEIDNVMLCKISEGANGWRYSHCRSLTLAEKQFVAGRNHD